MTVTVIGTIEDVGTTKLNGTVRISANKNFIDSDGIFHLKDKYFTSTITEGDMEVDLPETIKNDYTSATLTDDGGIITFTSLLDGDAGNDITVKIENGTGLTRKITIIYEDTTEIYYNLNMDESSPSTYIVDKITSDSNLVSVSRLSALNVDTLPTNKTTTNLAGGTSTNLVTYQGTSPVYYKFEFIDEYNNVFLMLNNIEIEYSASDIDIADLI